MLSLGARLTVIGFWLLALASQTFFFRLLPAQTAVILSTGIYVVLVLANLHRVPQAIFFPAVYFQFFFAIGAAILAMLVDDFRILVASLNIFLATAFFFLFSITCENRAISLFALDVFSESMLWLLVANSVIFLLVQAGHLQPLFVTTYGTLLPRTISHYGLSVSEDDLRFQSFFGEPSDLAWMAAVAGFVFLFRRKRLKAALTFVLAASGLSGSLVIIYGLLLAAGLGMAGILVAAGVVYYVSANSATIFFNLIPNDPAIQVVAQRWFGESGDVKISRSDPMSDFLGALSWFRGAVPDSLVLFGGNSSLLLLMATGIFFAPVLVLLFFDLAKLAYAAWRQNRYGGFAILCFAFLFFARESPFISQIYWFLYLAFAKLSSTDSATERPGLAIKKTSLFPSAL